jgi:hypothetical protein
LRPSSKLSVSTKEPVALKDPVATEAVGATVVDAIVVDAIVVDAIVVDATVVGAIVVDATVVDAIAVDATVVGATVVDATASLMVTTRTSEAEVPSTAWATSKVAWPASLEENTVPLRPPGPFTWFQRRLSSCELVSRFWLPSP